MHERLADEQSAGSSVSARPRFFFPAMNTTLVEGNGPSGRKSYSLTAGGIQSREQLFA
jgi:hypothetical protein